LQKCRLKRVLIEHIFMCTLRVRLVPKNGTSILVSIHPMALQPKSGLGLFYWGSIIIMFYGVRLLASRPAPVNFGGTYDFLLGFTPLAKGSSFKALKTRPPSHSHLLNNPLCIAPGPPRGDWESGFAGRACRLNTQEAFWYLTGHAYWHQHAPPDLYQPSVQGYWSLRKFYLIPDNVILYSKHHRIKP
jgi:hypothetical protein